MIPRERADTTISAQVGKKIKSIRKALGISQRDLAIKIDLTFQQVQKYEKGINRISVDKLVDICDALKVKLSVLLQDQLQKH